MKIPIIIKGNLIPNLFSIFFKVDAVTLFPFIFTNSDNTFLINHEKIHISQQKELYILWFYVLYLFDYLKGLKKYKNTFEAYKCIRFELEAYRYERNLNYLKNRPKYNWNLF